MAAGLMIAVALWVFAWAGMNDYVAQSKILPVAVIAIGIAGVIWLYDEITG
jgi:hypothetical protein